MSGLVNHLKNRDGQNLFLDVAYGKHIVEGDLCKSLTTTATPKDIYVQHKFGKREWNACLALYWRGFNIPAADYVFHPGKASTGNSDPVQGVDAIFNTDIPHNLTAWIRAKLPQAEVQSLDAKKEEPSGLYGLFETLKINNYNSSGGVTDFSYSANPAREIADLFTVEGKRPSSRIDWGAWTEWRDFIAAAILCDYRLLGGGNFEGFGLSAKYYNGDNFNTLKQERIDPVIEFGTSFGRPAYGIDEIFSAKYEGYIKPRFSETYTFYLKHNDGARLRIGGALLIDQFVASAGVTDTATAALTADAFASIEVDWNNLGGESEILLEWESASQPREVVPAERLYPKESYKPRYEAHPFFSRPTRLDDAVKTILRLCNSTYQRVNGKYRFFCYEQLSSSSFTFDEAINLYPDSVEIEPQDPSRVRNVWKAAGRDIDSQYLEAFRKPVMIERPLLIAAAGQRIDGEILDFFNTNRWQTHRLLEQIVKREVDAANAIKFTGNAETYPVLAGDRVMLNLEFLNLTNYETLVRRSNDKSSETTADDREFTLREWIS